MPKAECANTKGAGAWKDKGKGRAKAPFMASSSWQKIGNPIPKPEVQEVPRKWRKLNEGTIIHTSSFDATAPSRSASVDLKGKGKETMKETSRIKILEGATSGRNVKNGESLAALQKMVGGDMVYTEKHKLYGKYLAIDCEMVGVGINGSESSLGRVSIVNFHGYTMLDVFVRQKERVADYRTQWSGIRPKDMADARPFEEVQKQVADLIKDRILVGHAVHNDLKALLLSHPYPLTRDTQTYAGKFQLLGKSKRPALRNLVKQELGIVIQEGEHSSVIDARATMAIYRLHRKEWEKAAPRVPPSLHVNMDVGADTADGAKSKPKAKKRKRAEDDDGELSSDEEVLFPGGGRKNVSSGLSTVVRTDDKNSKGGNARGQHGSQKKAKSEWWKELPGGGGADGGKKGSMRVSMKL